MSGDRCLRKFHRARAFKAAPSTERRSAPMFRRSAGWLVCALLALLAAATAASAARAPRIWFPANRLPLAHATRLGAASPSQRMEVGVGLKDPHPVAEQALMAAQQSPASPQYHHFLTPAQYTRRFAVSK